VIRLFKYPKPNAHRMSKSYRTRTVITQTSVNDLPQLIAELEQETESEIDLYNQINHGDDILSNTFDGKRVVWLEGDIANNDSSHLDATFRQLYLADRYNGEDVLDAYSQLAYPVKFMSPVDRKKFIYARPKHGMRLPSGSPITTFGNSNKSDEIGLAHAFYGGDFATCAELVGTEVTTKTGGIEDVSFLSKIFFRSTEEESCEQPHKLRAILDLASVLRKFGHIVGDAPGRSKVPVCDRIVKATQEVVAGYIGEPDYLLMRVLRSKFNKDPVRTALEKGIKTIFNSDKISIIRRLVCNDRYTEKDLNEIDYGIIRHYYGKSELDIGSAEYLRCVNDTYRSADYGDVITSRFVDRTMAMRYGMSPCTCEE